MILYLGVNDVHYSQAGGGSTTTGEVAEWLEKSHHVMETFAQLHETDIETMLRKAYSGAVEAVAAGAATFPMINTSRIDSEFRNYLDRGEWEKTSGQVVQAARSRRRARHKDGSREQSRRSNRAFIRTGLYQASFRTWLKD